MSVGGVRPGGVGGVADHHDVAPAASGGAGAAAPALSSPKLANAELQQIAEGHGTIANGSKGDGVRALQNALLSAGYALPRYGADGGYGAEGMAAVKQLQKDAGLPQTGVVDAATIKALDRKLAPGGAGAAGGAGGTGATGGSGAGTITPPASSGRFAGIASLTAVAKGTATLGPGATDKAAVKACQQALMDMGFGLPKFGADGGYGGEMSLAVRRFQIDQGLPRTGKIDKATLAAMDKYAPPAGKTLEKFPEYDKIYEDGRADMTLAFGFDEDGATGGQVADTLRGLQSQGFHKVDPGSLSAPDKAKYGLTPDKVDAGIGYWVKDFKDPVSGKSVCAVAKILTPESAPTPEGVAKLYQKAIENDDVTMYDGHARYGTGPDFDHVDSAKGNYLINPGGNAADLEGDAAPQHLKDALKGKGLSTAGTTIAPDKYRLLFFDGCSTENYVPNLTKNLAGRNNGNLDIVSSTMPLSFGSGPTQLLNMVSGVTGRKSIDAINKANNEAEQYWSGSPDDKVRAGNAMLATGFLGNRGNVVR